MRVNFTTDFLCVCVFLVPYFRLGGHIGIVGKPRRQAVSDAKIIFLGPVLPARKMEKLTFVGVLVSWPTQTTSALSLSFAERGGGPVESSSSLSARHLRPLLL